MSRTFIGGAVSHLRRPLHARRARRQVSESAREVFVHRRRRIAVKVRQQCAVRTQVLHVGGGRRRLPFLFRLPLRHHQGGREGQVGPGVAVGERPPARFLRAILLKEVRNNNMDEMSVFYVVCYLIEGRRRWPAIYIMLVVRCGEDNIRNKFRI